MARYKAFISS